MLLLPTTKRVLRYVYFPGTQAGYRYDYTTPYGMIYRTNQLRGMTVSTTALTSTGSVTSDGQTAASTEYNYPTTASSLTDVPKHTRRTYDWAGRTTGMPGTGAAPYYTFSVSGTDPMISTITAPDGSISETKTDFSGQVYETSIKNGTTVLQKSVFWWGVDSRLDKIQTTNEANQTKTISYTYNAGYNNPSIVREYDFDTAPNTPGPELRRTETTYVTDSVYTASRGLLHLPASVKVFEGGATSPTSYVKYEYDQTSLDEPDATGSLGATSAPAQATSYMYDAMNNLVKVTQGTQQRFFKYDSLGHLTYERQVEHDAPHTASDSLTGNSSWSRRIAYSAQGLVTNTYDARNVRAQVTYDGLNRVTGVTYTGETTGTTPSVTYTYDQARTGYYNQGRLTEVKTTSGGTTQTLQAYDYNLMGAISRQQQTVSGTTYTITYAYNMAGQMTSETYPSGRVVSYSYDGASLLSSVADASRTYVNGFAYAAHGGLTSETWGNGGVHTLSYNNRLQASQVKLSVGGTERQRYDYLYGQVDQTTGTVDATKNTGQVARIEGYIDSVRQWQQRYSYDTLGRLDIAGEYRGDTLALVYRGDYDYDR
jgi:YD repeat-containing protein